MAPMLQVRIADGADAAAVEHVLLASYPVLMAEAYEAALLARALPIITRANPKLLGCGTYYLAEMDGTPVGCGGWTREQPGGDRIEPGLAHIRHFAVDAHWTGRGVGRALYARCERTAREAEVQRFECQASLNGEGFYAALGFVSAGPIGVPMGPDLTLPSILMHRLI